MAFSHQGAPAAPLMLMPACLQVCAGGARLLQQGRCWRAGRALCPEPACAKAGGHSGGYYRILEPKVAAEVVAVAVAAAVGQPAKHDEQQVVAVAAAAAVVAIAGAGAAAVVAIAGAGAV